MLNEGHQVSVLDEDAEALAMLEKNQDETWEDIGGQFTVGTGGLNVDNFGAPRPNSEVRSSGAYGVLLLTLDTLNYSWQFIPIAGQSFTDAGSTDCQSVFGTTIGSTRSRGWAATRARSSRAPSGWCRRSR